MSNKNYFLERNHKTKEIVYIEYENNDLYQVKPKVNKLDGIKVNSIVFVSPSFSEKIIKRKIDIKLNRLINTLQTIEETDDEGDGAVIRETLMDAERLKLMLINNYVKYLGNTYHNLTLRKIQIIINQLRVRLYMLKEKEDIKVYNSDENKGRGR